MRLIMRCRDTYCNVKVDAIDKQDSVVFAYRCPPDSMVATEFVGVFDLGSVDFLYVTEER